MADLPKLTVMPKLTPFNIWRLVQATLPSDMKPGVRTLSATFGIVKEFLGEEWTVKNLASGGNGFFALDISDTSTSDTRERGSHKAYHLAELMLNLQTVEGFDERIRGFLTGDSSQMESIFAELQVAAIIDQHDLPFRFVASSPTKGESYDIDVFKQGLQIHVEAKCKLESTDFHADTILDSLERARKQLPKGKPGVIFVKIPQAWVDDGKLVRIDLEQITSRFLRQTKRVVSVIFYVQFVAIENGRLRERHICHEFENANSAFREMVPCLIRGVHVPADEQGANPRWTRLMPLIEGHY
jgi:hypothetical protein